MWWYSPDQIIALIKFCDSHEIPLKFEFSFVCQEIEVTLGLKDCTNFHLPHLSFHYYSKRYVPDVEDVRVAYHQYYEKCMDEIEKILPPLPSNNDKMNW